MKNPRVTAKEWNLLKGAINRVFSRSELNAQARAKLRVVEHSDPLRKRVKIWKLCPECNKPEAQSNFQVDHITPKLAYFEHFAQLESVDDYIDRVWCDPSNLIAICVPCHKIKSLAERKLRTAHNRLLRPPKAKKAVAKRKKK